jgi:RHS repeat-associated protein
MHLPRKHMKFLILMVAFSIAGKLQAQTIEQPILKVLSGSKGQIKKDSSSTVEDDKWWIPAEKAKLDLTGQYRIKNIISLKINEDTPAVLKPKFTVVVRFKLFITRNDGAIDSTQTPYLTITYDTLTGATYNSQSVFTFYNAYRVKAKIISVDSSYTPAGVSPKPPVTPFLRLENEMQIVREYNYTCTAASSLSIGINASNLPTTGEINASWQSIQGATEYDLEWAYIDNESLLDPDLYKTTGSLDAKKIFNNNSSRVTVAGTSYNIPLLYDDQGTLFIRFRPVQNKPNLQRYEGNWSSDNATGLGQYANFPGHEAALNWQATTSFAEEGKRKSVVQYYDGSLRSRQTVTKDNFTNTTVVAETLYDFQGRPVIQILPAPTLSNLIGYSKNFNRGINGAYEKNLYDTLLNPTDYCQTSAPAMKTDSGAAKYYSVNNPQAGIGFNKYIPDAQGYAFTETRYLQDNTGRISSQSGVGASYMIGSGHETRYFYGNPDQKELDGLFGTEVGYASHYFKNMVRDANGQYSVSYTDMHGRTIATALAGKTPSGMDSLSSSSTKSITEKLSDSTNNIAYDLVLESSRSILVPSAGDYVFNYSLNPDSIRIQTCAATNICYDCLYNLAITITDECNNCHLPNQQPYTVVDSNFTFGNIDTVCNTINGFNKSFTIALPEGNYTVIKKLSVSRYGYEYYRDSIFMKKNTCKTFKDFYKEVSDTIKSQIDCNQVSCDSCTVRTASLASFRLYYLKTAGIPFADSAQYRDDIALAYITAIDECNSICGNAGENTFIRKAMLLDMTVPVGQYANPDSANTANSYGNIFNVSYPIWRYIVYHDEYGKPDSIVNNAGVLVPPTDPSIAQQDFINSFNDSWANDLLPWHPEYIKLINYETHAPSHVWDEKFGSSDTYSDANTKGYLNPAGLTGGQVPVHFNFVPANLDPLAKQDSLLNGTMQGIVYQYKKDPDVAAFISMWGIASVAGKCPDNNTCASNYFNYSINNCINPSTFCTGELDMAWRTFRQIYLTQKRKFLMHQLHLNYPWVRVIIPAYRNEHFAESNAAIDDYIASVEGQNSGGVINDANGKLQQFYKENCEDYAASWWTSLAPCNLTVADSLRLIPRMVAICVAGSDASHTYGSSSTPASSTLQYKSFEALVKHYIDSMHLINPAQYNYDISCNSYSIYQPQPYAQQSALSNVMLWTKPDSCQCSTLNTLYNQYAQFGAGDASFSAYILRITGTVVSNADLTKLRNLCSGADTCKFMVTPISLPPAMQCGIKDVCVTCSKVKDAFNSFKIEFPSVYPSYNGDDSLQAAKNKVFANYMNTKLGFSKQAPDYLAFMDSSCAISFTTPVQVCDSFQTTLNNCVSCDTMAKVYSQFLTAYPAEQLLDNDTTAKVTYDSLFAAFCNSKLGLGINAGKYYARLQSCGIPYYIASTTAPTFQGPVVNNATSVPGSLNNLVCDSLNKYLTDFAIAFPNLGQWNLVSIKKRKTFTPILSYLLSCSGITKPYPPGRIVNPQNWVGSGLRDSAYGSLWYRNNLTFVKFNFTSLSGKVFVDSSNLRMSPILSAAFDPSVSWCNMLTDWDTTLSCSQLSVSFNGFRISSYTPLYQYVSPLNNPINVYNVKTQITLGFMYPQFNKGHVLASFLNPAVSAGNSESFVGVSNPLAQTDPETMPRIEIQYRLDSIYNCKDLLAAYLSSRINAGLMSYDTISAWYLRKCGNPIPLVCPPATGPLLCGKNEALFPPIVLTDDNPCADSTSLTFVKASELYTAYMDSMKNSFDSVYLNKCKKAFKTESFTVTHPQSEYHYTLYYYDQAGNLLKTIPPEGVDLSAYSRATWLDSVAIARKNGTLLTPSHGLTASYRYNTLNQAVAQNTPDAGMSSFWYDRLGRLVISQNARQKAVSATETNRQYSYTLYDVLGRITEVGQLKNATTNVVTQTITSDTTLFRTWFNAATAYNTTTKIYTNTEQVTRTVYDNKYPSAIGLPVLDAKNLRNRVAYTTYTEGNSPANYNQASFYSYDIHGNVDTLMQDYGQSITGVTNVMNSNGSRWKRMVYRYDLISGKVNHVAYQPQYVSAGALVITQDAFYHRYSYDAENRITLVETSADSTVWERDARYEYYKHGLLARSVIGQLQVQGMDYAYTLQGWLKGVNATSLTHTLDMGNDGDPTSNATKYIARDVYGYNLNYFNGDYATIGGVNPFAPVNSSGILPASDFRPLYNGNISSMAVNIRKFNSAAGTAGDSALLYNYKYDQLNRIKEMDAFRGLNTGTNSWAGATKITNYQERISYDANGNILKYLRNGNLAGTSQKMDSLTYKYNYVNSKLQNNKLNWVKDSVVNTALYAGDIESQAAFSSTTSFNYQYDEIGNMVVDSSEGIRKSVGGIKWNVYGKITEINKVDSSTTVKNFGRIKKITYTYDAGGNRISKKVEKYTTGSTIDYTWYARDASGNVMSTYSYSVVGTSLTTGNLLQDEVYLYGSSRLGSLKLGRNVELTKQTWDTTYTLALGLGTAVKSPFTRGNKQYELVNHLGNVLVTVSDKKIGFSTNGTTIDYYNADVITANDYYPFGMMMPGKNYNAPNGKDYRYGFNGKENDNEVKGEGNQQDYGMRIYDGRLGRFLSVDPLIKKLPWLSPYSFAGNNPIALIEKDGGQPIAPSPIAVNVFIFPSLESMTDTGPNGNVAQSSMYLQVMEQKAAGYPVEIIIADNLQNAYNKVMEYKEKGGIINNMVIDSHGDHGKSFSIGTTHIDCESVSKAVPMLREMTKGMVGSIVLTGCQVGNNKDLLNSVASITGTSVYASKGWCSDWPGMFNDPSSSSGNLWKKIIDFAYHNNEEVKGRIDKAARAEHPILDKLGFITDEDKINGTVDKLFADGISPSGTADVVADWFAKFNGAPTTYNPNQRDEKTKELNSSIYKDKVGHWVIASPTLGVKELTPGAVMFQPNTNFTFTEKSFSATVMGTIYFALVKAVYGVEIK